MDANCIYALTVCFGVSSWVTINGIFSILPLIIDKVPEGWAVASTLGLAIQAANIGPLAYRLYRKDFKAIGAVVYGIIALGALSMVMLARFWDVTFEINGSPCSVALIFFTFTAAVCDCTSSVVFWPLVGTLSPTMISGLALGENLSGVVAGFVSWLGLSPRNSFFALAAVLVMSCIAFRKLQQAIPLVASSAHAAASEAFVAGKPLSPTCPHMVVGLMSLFENAVLPSILPYATARHSQADYHIASTLPVGPLAVFTLVYFQASRRAVVAIAVSSLCMVCLIMWVGLGGANLSADLTITVVVLTKVCVAYSKAASMYHLKTGAATFEEAQRHLEKGGEMMQVWSLSGAILMFIFVHYTSVLPPSV